MNKSLHQRFYELTGGCWHEGSIAQLSNPYDVRHGMNVLYCKHCKLELALDYELYHPAYSNAADILNRMKEFCGDGRYKDFIAQKNIGVEYLPENAPVHSVWKIMLYEEYILNPTALLRKAVEFLEGEMKRQIVCEQCSKRYTGRGDGTSYDGEWFKHIKGTAKADMFCDLCGTKINRGDECSAESMGLTENPYYKWESGYLEVK